MRLLLIVLTALLPATAQAQVESSCQIIVQAPQCTIQFGRQSCKIVEDCGSGTCVANQDGKSYVATCKHLFKQAEKAWDRSRIVLLNNGRAYVAKPFSQAVGLDLAIVVVDGLIPAAELDAQEDSDIGSDVESFGFPGGQREVARIKHQIVGNMSDGSLFTNRDVMSGTSGGGLFRRGRLRGVIWGADSNPNNVFSPDPSIRKNPRITTAIRSKHVYNILRQDGIRCRCFEKSRSVVVAPLPPQDTPVPPPPIEPVSKVGPRGPKGEPGEVGPQGPAGKDADQSVIAQLQGRIDELEKQLKAVAAKVGPPGRDGRDGVDGKPGTVTVTLVNEDGTVLKSVENVQSGSVVRLNIKKFLEKE